MSTVIYALGFYAAAIVFVGGLAHRIWSYASTPAPLKIPTTPAPLTRSGAVLRVLREVVLFHSLFKANKWIWLFSWIFHGGLLLVLVCHLRYFLQPVWSLVALVQPFGVYAGMAMVGALTALWARRIIVPRIRYISGPSDHLLLLLLIGIGGSGLVMRYAAHTDIVAVKAFFLGLIRFHWQPLPADAALLAHLTMVIVAMLVFPFSKLLHAPGVFFSPTRNQADDTRERHYRPRGAKAARLSPDVLLGTSP